MTEVAIALRKSGEYPHKGRILALALGLVDWKGNLSEVAQWKLHSPVRAIGSIQDPSRPKVVATVMSGETLDVHGIATSSSALEVESQLREVNLMVLAADDPADDETTLGEMTQDALVWWGEHVGTDRFANPKPTFIGIKPEQTRAWLVQHVPALAELLGESIDVNSVAWALHQDKPEIPSEVAGELQIAADLVAKVIADLAAEVLSG